MYAFRKTLKTNSKNTFKFQFINFLKGIIIGFTSFIPGIGPISTTFILNIYKDYLKIIDNFVTLIQGILQIGFKNNKYYINKIKRSFFGLFSDLSIPLFFGIFLGIVIFTFIFSFLLFNLPSYVRAIFFGINLACGIYIYKLIKNFNSQNKLIFIASFFVLYFLLSFTSNNIFYNPSYLLVLLSGFLTSLTFVIPGLGLSFFLLLLNTYHYLLELLYSIFYSTNSIVSILQLILFIVSILSGIIFIKTYFTKILKNNLDTYLTISSAAMFASLRLLYPFIKVSGDTLTYVKPFDLPIGHIFFITSVTLISFIVTSFLSYYFYNKKS